MTIGVIVNEDKDTGLAVAKRLVDEIFSRGGKSFIATGIELDVSGSRRNDQRDLQAKNRAAFNDCDIFICIGGDGTLIKAARETLRYRTPVLGVNLGSFGYLTEVETTQIDMMLDRIFNNDYRVEERMMLSIARESGAAAYTGESRKDCALVDTALNELAVGRGDTPRVVRLKIYINDVFLDNFSGDGILISTPTGSTAYSLSAGGPVIDPELSVISIVPVCSHAIFSRPVLVAPDKTITIVPVNADGAFQASVSVDGFIRPALGGDEIIKVRRAEHVTKMLRFDPDNFYAVLKNKLFDTSNKRGFDAEHREISVYG